MLAIRPEGLHAMTRKISSIRVRIDPREHCRQSAVE
jgi:hypothetical protein